jgi:hypothetical protein
VSAFARQKKTAAKQTRADTKKEDQNNKRAVTINASQKYE